MNLKIVFIVVLVLSTFLRIYRTPDLLGFWFDQGRDARVAWNIIHNKDLTLIGPTTGIEGIFLGPFYYYLITPFYLISNGDPVIPAISLALINVGAVILLYKFAKENISELAGVLSASVYGLSFSFVYANRWLSNPTALPFVVVLIFIQILKIINNSESKRELLFLGLLLGISLQLEAASAIFFIPATLLIFIIHEVVIKKYLLLLPGFLMTLMPQLIFDFRNDHLLFKSFQKFLITERSFQAIPIDFFTNRISFYYHSFFDKFFSQDTNYYLFSILLLIAIFVGIRKVPIKITRMILIWIFTPLTLLLFYHGNNGYVWDYYFTGLYPIFALLVGVVFAAIIKSSNSYFKGLVFTIIIVMSIHNFSIFSNFFSHKYPAYISLTPIINSIDWVYSDSQDQNFNVDIYVPPVISHSYDYVFLWRGSKIHNKLPTLENTKLLYTILEPDLERPHYRENWLNRQNGFSTVIASEEFGPILVQKRQRNEINP